MEVLIGNELSASGRRLGDVRGLIRHDRSAAADWLSPSNASKEPSKASVRLSRPKGMDSAAIVPA
jgi:hypothetical protein